MKVRLMLLATMLLAFFAAMPVGAASPRPNTVTAHYSVLLKHSEEYRNVSGLADYKEYDGGAQNFGRSVLTVTVSAKSLRNLDLYVQVSGDSGSTWSQACVLTLGARGNGFCTLDSSNGDTVPIIVRGSSEVLVSTNPDSTFPDVVEGEFE